MWQWILLSIAVLTQSMPHDAQSSLKGYSDAYTRNQIFSLCSAAYCFRNREKCIEGIYPGGSIKRVVNVPCDYLKLDHCVAFSGSSVQDKTIFISFRGTTEGLQLILESEQTVLSNRTAWPSGGLASKYFAQGFLDLWNGGLKDDFTQLINAYPNFDVVVTGHSLGGALASLAASYIGALGLVNPNRIKLVTMGQPRTGDVNYAAGVDAMIPYTYRVVHHKDIVPHLPPNGLEEYHHHKNEIWYNNDMTSSDFKECDADESISCSDSLEDTSLADHTSYFHTDMCKHVEQGCPQLNPV